MCLNVWKQVWTLFYLCRGFLSANRNKTALRAVVTKRWVYVYRKWFPFQVYTKSIVDRRYVETSQVLQRVGYKLCTVDSVVRRKFLQFVNWFGDEKLRSCYCSCIVRHNELPINAWAELCSDDSSWPWIRTADSESQTSMYYSSWSVTWYWNS